MAARRRTSFPGLPTAAATELVGMQDDLSRDTTELRQETVGSTTDTKTASGYAAKYNEIVRVQMPAAGGSVVFPAAAVGSVNKWIDVLVLTGSGPVKVVPTSLLVDGAASVTLTTAGRYSFRSDGLTSWWRATNGAGGGGGSQGWDDTLAIDATSGANDPIVNVGRFIQFGAVGPTTSNPQIRSGDATFRIRGGGNVFILADGASGIAALAATANGGTAIVQGQGTGGTATLSSLLSSAIIDGNAVLVNVGGVTRISIANTGEWITPAGASGQVWTHQGAGTPPIWAAAGGGGGADPRIFAWFGV